MKYGIVGLQMGEPTVGYWDQAVDPEFYVGTKNFNYKDINK